MKSQALLVKQLSMKNTTISILCHIGTASPSVPAKESAASPILLSPGGGTVCLRLLFLIRSCT